MLLDLHTDFSGGMSGGLIFPSLQEFSTVCCDLHKDFGIVNKVEVDIFLEFSCFFDDPMDVGNLISGSAAFSKSSLNIWNFTVHIVLKPGLENFEHYFASQTLTVFHLISPSMWVKQEKDKLYAPSFSPAYHLLHHTSQFRSHLEQQGPTKGRSQGIWSTNSRSHDWVYEMYMTG